MYGDIPMLQYIVENKEWVFSGIGVFVITLFSSFLFHVFTSKHEYTICKHTDENKYKVIKEGWHWIAFFLTYSWLIAEELYEALAFSLLIPGVLFLHALAIYEIFHINAWSVTLWIAIASVALTPFILGYYASFLLKRKYFNKRSKDYFYAKKTISASSKNAALELYLNNYKDDY